MDELIVVVCIVCLVHAIIIMGGSTIHMVGIGVGGEWRIYKVLVGGLCGEFIVAVDEFKYVYLEVWVGLGMEGGLSTSKAPKMHNIPDLSQGGQLHLGR